MRKSQASCCIGPEFFASEDLIHDAELICVNIRIIHRNPLTNTCLVLRVGSRLSQPHEFEAKVFCLRIVQKRSIRERLVDTNLINRRKRQASIRIHRVCGGRRRSSFESDKWRYLPTLLRNLRQRTIRKHQHYETTSDRYEKGTLWFRKKLPQTPGSRLPISDPYYFSMNTCKHGLIKHNFLHRVAIKLYRSNEW